MSYLLISNFSGSNNVSNFDLFIIRNKTLKDPIQINILAIIKYLYRIQFININSMILPTHCFKIVFTPLIFANQMYVYFTGLQLII